MNLCPRCGVNLLLVGRVHRCEPHVTNFVTMREPAAARAVVTVVTVPPAPKRDRAAYMREYRARSKASSAANGPLGFGS